MFNNPYLNNINSQTNLDRIDAQINELEKMKRQIQQPMQPSINQTFQLSSNTKEQLRYANSMEDVQREPITGEVPFFSKDMSILWLKNSQNEIKTYELNEIVPKDEKDIKIEYLMAQIEDLKKEMRINELNAGINDAITEPIEDEKSTNVSKLSKSTKKSK